MFGLVWFGLKRSGALPNSWGSSATYRAGPEPNSAPSPPRPSPRICPVPAALSRRCGLFRSDRRFLDISYPAAAPLLSPADSTAVWGGPTAAVPDVGRPRSATPWSAGAGKREPRENLFSCLCLCVIYMILVSVDGREEIITAGGGRAASINIHFTFLATSLIYKVQPETLPSCLPSRELNAAL